MKLSFPMKSQQLRKQRQKVQNTENTQISQISYILCSGGILSQAFWYASNILQGYLRKLGNLRKLLTCPQNSGGQICSYCCHRGPERSHTQWSKRKDCSRMQFLTPCVGRWVLHKVCTVKYKPHEYHIWPKLMDGLGFIQIMVLSHLF